MVSKYLENKNQSYDFLQKETMHSNFFKKKSHINSNNYENNMVLGVRSDLKRLYDYCLTLTMKNKLNMFNNIGYIVWDELDDGETQEDQLFFDEIYDFQPLEVIEKESNLLLLNFTNTYLLNFLSFYNLNCRLLCFNKIFLYEGRKLTTFNNTITSDQTT